MRRLGRIGIWAVVLAVLGGAGWLIWNESRTNSGIEAAETALEADDLPAALRYLERPLANRADSAKVQFLAARAYRRTGNIVLARQHLAKAKALNWVEEAIDLETGLLQAQTNSLTPVYDVYLRKCLTEDHPDAKLIAEVLAPLDYGELRLQEALHATELWTRKQPTSAKAWSLLGVIQDRFRMRASALDSYRKAVELAPADTSHRLALARQLLAIKSPPEKAAEILEQLVREEPGNVTFRLVLAYCRIEQGRADDSEAVLEELLREQPNSAQAIHLRGRIEMMRDRPEKALVYFRKCVELTPYETEMLYSLGQALNRTGPAAEAAAVRERWERSTADLGKLGELSREASRQPDRAEFRHQAGEICLRNGLEKEGVQWLISALKIQPDHGPSHRLLAEYYQKIGRPDRAEYHKTQADKTGG